VSVWCTLCVCVQSPALRGSSALIELNGDDLRRDPLNVRKASAVESGRVLVGPNSARVLRRLGVAVPISTGLIVRKGAYQLKGAYHVSLHHSFNRGHYRHGTC
jgi:hypothetical protein